MVALDSEKANLHKYKTYQIVEGSGVIYESAESLMLYNLDMKQMINDELAKKGKILVTKNPDFYVAYMARVDMDALKIKLDKKGKEIMENVPAAAIMFFLLDAKTNATIWISSVEGEVTNLPDYQKKKRLNYAIKKMLSSM